MQTKNVIKKNTLWSFDWNNELAKQSTFVLVVKSGPVELDCLWLTVWILKCCSQGSLKWALLFFHPEMECHSVVLLMCCTWLFFLLYHPSIHAFLYLQSILDTNTVIFLHISLEYDNSRTHQRILFKLCTNVTDFPIRNWFDSGSHKTKKGLGHWWSNFPLTQNIVSAVSQECPNGLLSNLAGNLHPD